MVGAGVFDSAVTVHTMASVIPSGVTWIKAAVTAFEPAENAVILEGCRVVKYKRLVVCPGLKLDWRKVDGLVETLGRNGVTSNYRFDLAPYTWELVRSLKSGRAIFTQRRCPSSARAHRRRRCICPRITGIASTVLRTSKSSSAMLAAFCSESRTMFLH
jgi:sulfide:quinone oxidoreductase